MTMLYGKDCNFTNRQQVDVEAYLTMVCSVGGRENNSQHSSWCVKERNEAIQFVLTFTE